MDLKEHYILKILKNFNLKIKLKVFKIVYI